MSTCGAAQPEPTNTRIPLRKRPSASAADIHGRFFVFINQFQFGVLHGNHHPYMLLDAIVRGKSLTFNCASCNAVCRSMAGKGRKNGWKDAGALRRLSAWQMRQ